MKIKVAAIQMDAQPAPTPERLERAGQLAARAAQAGARLAALPELFNSGYIYSDENFTRAEALDGMTAAWMRETARRLQIHLAGTFLALEQGEIYNTMLLYAPDGRRWRYDKNFPWGWERGYFRPGRQTSIAHTELGDIGMLICWDAAHAKLWRRYAGKVDLMLICSCPPDVTNPTYILPGGDPLSGAQLGPVVGKMRGRAGRIFGEMIDQQTAWLGTPTISAMPCGTFQSPVPKGKASLLLMLPGAPWLVKYLGQADQIELACSYVQGCKIVSKDGQVLSEVRQEQGESLAVAEVDLADSKKAPQGRQPKTPVSWLAYFLSDFALPRVSVPVYKAGVRRVCWP